MFILFDTAVPSHEEISIEIQKFDEEAYDAATVSGYAGFEASFTLGGDDISITKEDVNANKYHMKHVPVDAARVFRGSCTGNLPTQHGSDAAKKVFSRLSGLE